MVRPVLAIALGCTLLCWTSIASAKVVVTPIARLKCGDQHAPDIEGKYVVYADNYLGNDDIFLYNTSTKVRKRIQNGPEDDTDPRISGDHVVYRTTSSSGGGLMCYTISTGENHQLNTGFSDILEHAVYGDTVAFVARTFTESGPPETRTSLAVATVSLSTGATETISTYGQWPHDLAIAGNYLAYSYGTDWDGNDDTAPIDLCVANLSNDTTTVVDHGDSARVTSDGTVTYCAPIWGEYDQYSPEMHVSRYDATTDTSTVLFDGFGKPADVSAGRLLYYDAYNNLWVYNLKAGTRLKIATPKARWWVGHAAMSGTRVVWDDVRHRGAFGNVWPPGTPGHFMDYDVYSATYSSPMFTLECPKGVTYGKRATVAGKLSTTAGAAYAGQVTLQRSTDKKHWKKVTTKSTTASGRFSAKSGVLRKRTYFRVKFVKGTRTSTSYYITVKPRMIVSKPKVAARVALSKASTTITGRITPAVTKASDIMIVGGRKLANGTWWMFGVSSKIYKPVAHTGYSTYKVKIKVFRPIKAEKWRVRVRARNAAKGLDWGKSSYAYFTVH